jgi:energy-coupling factor transporter ATP-binding protein EcfA2/predicted transcriptional regulator
MQELIGQELIGERLLQKGLLTEEQLNKALERQKIYGGRIGTNLIALGFITRDMLDSFLRPSPTMPKCIEDTGLPQNVITELILKTILSMGEFTIPDVALRVKLPISIVDQTIQLLRKERLVEVKGAAQYTRISYQHVITSQGRSMALELMDICQYVGPAPVCYDDYVRVVCHQTVKNFDVKEDDIKNAFSHLTISENTLKRIGPAVTSGKSMFLYGPPGNGKTTIAQTIGSIFKEDIYIPYALYVGGQIISIYDPVTHEVVDNKAADGVDQRWLLIKRPIIMVGGELTLRMLELNFNSISKFYEAPIQMKANNGMLVVDDFGRQLVQPQDLLNRWIVPLDRRIDYMKLHTGMSFEIPFDQLIIFSTNIDPKDLVDEAFMRRIRYKIYIGYPSEQEYKKIFRQICDFNKIDFREDIFDYLMKKYKKSGINLCAAHPRDLIGQITDFSHYYNTPPVLTEETIDMGWNNFIVEL